MPAINFNPNIDIGLSVLCAIAKPGQTLTQTEIAKICGCSRNAIWTIEQNALKKAKQLAQAKQLQLFLQD